VIDVSTIRQIIKDRGTMLHDAPPYRPWLLNETMGFPWGIRGAGGFNCFGYDGAVCLPSKEMADAVIAAHATGEEE
jgi:hypothetical protein